MGDAVPVVVVVVVVVARWASERVDDEGVAGAGEPSVPVAGCVPFGPASDDGASPCPAHHDPTHR